MDNEELINRYELVSIEQINLLKEILIRYDIGEISKEEWSRVEEISLRRGADLFDSIPKVDKKTLIDCIDSAISNLTDENR